VGIPLSDVEQVCLSRDELEALKLCDLDDLTQEEAGGRMGISRGTVQRTLAEARRKVASALSRGKAIVFE
jgi:RNA polymerase sigma factor (sigma-70 family)